MKSFSNDIIRTDGYSITVEHIGDGYDGYGLAKQILEEEYKRYERQYPDNCLADSCIFEEDSYTFYANGEDVFHAVIERRDLPNETLVVPVNTKYGHGSIVACESSDPRRPGIWVEFVPDETPKDKDYITNPTALLECDSRDDGRVRILVWGDTKKEDYTDDFDF